MEQKIKRSVRAHIRNTASLAGVVGPLVLATTTLIVHLFRENYDWIHETLSELGLGPHGWIENTGFIIFGVCMVIFAEALYGGFKFRKSLAAAVAAWVLIGFGFIIVGFFHTNMPGSLPTLHGTIHGYSAKIVAAIFPIVCFLLIPSFEHDPHWDHLVLYTIGAGVVALLFDSLHFILPSSLLKPWVGAYERLMALNAIIWLEVVAIHLLPHRRDLG